MPEKLGHRPRVLIVEDEENTARYMRYALERTCDCEIAGNVRTTIERLAQLPAFDAILLDISLPDGQGVAVIQTVQNAHPETPIIVVTGSDMPQWEAFEAGAQEFLRKPDDTSGANMFAAVARAISRHRARRILEPARREIPAMREAVSTSNRNIGRALDTQAAQISQIEKGQSVGDPRQNQNQDQDANNAPKQP